MSHISVRLKDEKTTVSVHDFDDVKELFDDGAINRPWAESAVARIEQSEIDGTNNSPEYDPVNVSFSTGVQGRATELVESWETALAEAAEVEDRERATGLVGEVPNEGQGWGIEKYFENLGEARPGQVFQDYLQSQPFSGLSRDAQTYMEGLGDRAMFQYMTSPTLDPPIEEDGVFTPVTGYGDFLERGEQSQQNMQRPGMPSDMFGDIGLPFSRAMAGGEYAGDPIRRFMNPEQMIDRLKGIGGKIMAPVAAGETDVIGEDPRLNFLRERMLGLAPEDQLRMISEPIMAGTTNFPGMREALGRITGRRFARQRRESPETPFLRWWGTQEDPVAAMWT